MTRINNRQYSQETVNSSLFFNGKRAEESQAINVILKIVKTKEI